jgi:hypothetical protein
VVYSTLTIIYSTMASMLLSNPFASRQHCFVTISWVQRSDRFLSPPSVDSGLQGEKPLRVELVFLGEKAEVSPDDRRENTQLSDLVMHEQDGEGSVVHTLALIARKEGCIIPRVSEGYAHPR